MDNQYIFVLGRNPELSIAEIKAVFEKNNWKYQVILESREIFLVSSEKADPSVLHKALGGTVKIGVVEKISNQEALEQDLTVEFLEKNILSGYSGKIQFGISVYDGGDRNATENLSGKIIEFSKGIKALLENTGRSVRFAFSRERTLSSVTVDKNKLIEKGAELLLIPTRDQIFIGKTLFVQEFEKFSNRDYGRPARDMKSGVMPPKLARMMINLAGVPLEASILDPFCGSGTILQEALLLGYKNIIGKDVSGKAVADTEKNLEWLKSEIQFDSNISVNVSVGDVTKLSSNIPQESISGIITEPYLGPTLHGQLYPEKLKSITRELSSLYLKAFSEFHKVLKQNGVVVMILPAFSQRQDIYFLPILEEIERLGFKKEMLSAGKRGTILYGNKYDFVQREIVVMKKI